jgi:hypothetical protein
MISAIADLIRVALFEPTVASTLGALLTGQPELAPELVAICERESHCRPVGIHVKDASAGKLMRRKALRAGWLDRNCPFHSGSPRRFSTRGVHGISAAYSLRFLGSCLPPEALDIPLLSAIAASRRAAYQCRRYDACNQQERHRMWMGAGKHARLTKSEGLAKNEASAKATAATGSES